jgi:hypothetical protein
VVCLPRLASFVVASANAASNEQTLKKMESAAIALSIFCRLLGQYQSLLTAEDG